MAKSATKTIVTVRDSRTGRFLTVKGVGSLSAERLPIKKGIDLTKPIAKQALREAKRSKS